MPGCPMPRMNERNATPSRLCGVRLVFCGIDLLPFAVLNSLANLRRSFTLSGLLVRIKRFAHADIAHRSVGAGKTIEQAAVAVRSIAMAVTWLLIQNFLHFSGESIRILNHRIIESRWIQRVRKRAGGRLGIIRGP